METDICHICLDEHYIITSELLKTCCDAYICNPCWDILLNNPLVSQCPICGTEFQITIEIEINNPQNGNIRLFCRRFIMIIKWISIGYFAVCLFVLLFYRDLEEFFTIMDDLNLLLYFWPLCCILGYSIVVFIEYYSDHICHNWYN